MLTPIVCTRGAKCGMGAVYCESVPCGRVIEGQWAFLSRAPSDWSYVFGTQRFADESAARECFEAAKKHAAENGGAGSLECGGRQVERFSIWCPND